jgi:hypothetical protein
MVFAWDISIILVKLLASHLHILVAAGGRFLEGNIVVDYHV